MNPNQRRRRLSLAWICATLSAYALSASPAFAEYRAWYSPWDYIGQFEAEDVSEDYTKLNPPAGACGFKMVNPGVYRWADSYGNTVQDEDGDDEAANISGDAIIWLGLPGCSQPFSTVTSSNGVTQTIELPEAGATYLEIHGSESAHWVDDNGCHLSGCGGVEPPDFDLTDTQEQYWLLTVISAFKVVTPALLDPQLQPRAVTPIAKLSQDVVDVQRRLQKLIVERRRTPLGVFEASVRSIEDAATQALVAAQSSAATCEKRTRERAYGDAFAACTAASRYIEHSAALIRTATSTSR